MSVGSGSQQVSATAVPNPISFAQTQDRYAENNPDLLKYLYRCHCQRHSLKRNRTNKPSGPAFNHFLMIPELTDLVMKSLIFNMPSMKMFEKCPLQSAEKMYQTQSNGLEKNQTFRPFLYFLLQTNAIYNIWAFLTA